MNTPSQEPDDQLTRAYRDASDAQAGGPAAATRAAILAEARAAALRRTPAANQSRYVWRAAAGIAVLGVAVILWRQTDRRLAPDLTVAAPERAAEAEVPPAAAPQAAADVANAGAVGAGVVAANRAVAPATDTAAAAPAPKDEEAAESKAAPATREREEASGVIAASEATRSPMPLASARADVVAPAPPAPSEAAGAVRRDGPDYQQLVQREFPEVWNGSEPLQTLWVVIDASGKVLRKGTLAQGAAFTADQPFESQRPWMMVQVTTASGSSLRLAVMSVN